MGKIEADFVARWNLIRNVRQALVNPIVHVGQSESSSEIQPTVRNIPRERMDPRVQTKAGYLKHSLDRHRWIDVRRYVDDNIVRNALLATTDLDIQTVRMSLATERGRRLIIILRKKISIK